MHFQNFVQIHFLRYLQFFSDHITKRKISLPKQQMQRLFESGSCDSSDTPDGYYALLIEGQPSASVYLENNEVRIKLTHPFHID